MREPAPVHRPAPANAPLLLEVSGLTTEFASANGAPARALEDVALTLREGEALGIVGESGCGKTTLMLSLLRLLPAGGRVVHGRVAYRGRDLLALDERALTDVRWREIAIIFQGAMNALNPVRTVGDQIAEALRRHDLAPNRRAAMARVGELLDLVGIGPERADQYPHQYSGGMRQRAMIAMALACNPAIVIADEPTTALDVMIQAQILALLERLRDRLGLAILFVTHDLGVVAELCDSVLVMYGGMVAEYAAVDTIFNDPRHPYTQELLRAFPDLTRPAARLASIPGTPPRLNALPPGCRFAPRCPAAFERCHVENPRLHRIAAGHDVRCHLAEEQ